MHEPVFVRVCKSCGELRGDRGRLGILQTPSVREPCLEGAAREVLESHVGPSGILTVVVHARHVRMRQGCSGTRFALEPRPIRLRRQELERHRSLELEVVCKPDFGHRALPEERLEPVAPRQDARAHADTVFP